jgi:hypothetical protein
MSATVSGRGAQIVLAPSGQVVANNIDCFAGEFFTKTISGATALTVSKTPGTNAATSFVLELTNGGSATITWWAGIRWPGGSVPALTAAGVDVLGFYTLDGGTTWRGLVLGLAMA